MMISLICVMLKTIFSTIVLDKNNFVNEIDVDTNILDVNLLRSIDIVNITNEMPHFSLDISKCLSVYLIFLTKSVTARETL